MTQDPVTPGGAVPGPPRGAGQPVGDGARTTDVAATTAGGAGPLAGLDGLDEVPVGEHVERFARVHDALRARLDGEPEPGERDGTDPHPGPAR
ncbi:hypothetical protein [Isoptericola sp. NPDC057559]|uniref:hypothetical protein n=1 Tax=Isoptericola sp. NPDC057559 TaxID=3346168 RepID=UPI0036AD8388